jgi:hypothetical protein
MRAGDFSELPVTIYDPLTRTPFLNNQIPAGRLNPIAQKYLALLPPNTNGALANNLSTQTLRTQNSGTMDFRVDERFNTNNQMFVRYSYNNVGRSRPPPVPDGRRDQPGCSGGLAFPGPNNTTAHNAQVNYVRVSRR